MDILECLRVIFDFRITVESFINVACVSVF